MSKRKVGLYARTSTVQHQSTERQIEELKLICKNHDYEIVDIYNDEGVSGSKKNRPELDRMMSDVFKRKFDTLMTLELSRLGRSVSNMCEILEQCKSSNVSLFIVNQKIDTDQIIGEFFFNVLNSISQFEKDLIRERIMSGLENAKRKGVKLGRQSTLTLEKELKVIQMHQKKIGINKIKQELGLGYKTVRTVIDTHRKKMGSG